MNPKDINSDSSFYRYDWVDEISDEQARLYHRAKVLWKEIYLPYFYECQDLIAVIHKMDGDRSCNQLTNDEFATLVSYALHW